MDPLAYLLGLEQIGIKFGLANIAALCDRLGRPQDAFRSVIVAGTNGKGSVTAMIDGALRAAGLRSARYTSPHLVDVRERFCVSGQPVDRGTFADVVDVVRGHAERLVGDGGLPASPTFFEVTTAVAFEIFRRAHVDVAVLEVGLGGRFDATNIVSPIAAAVTSIDLDHQAYLGHSYTEIAREKAGVIKPGIPVVAGVMPPDAAAVIRQVCAAEQARYIDASEGCRLDTTFIDGRAIVDLTTPGGVYPRLRLALRGRHQIGNAIVAIRLLEALADIGMPLPAAAIQSGIEDVEWRGRLDLITVAPNRRVLLDAAHNPAGAAVLAQYLREVHPGGLPFVFAAMKDKDAGGMLRALVSSVTHLVLTAPDMARAAEPSSLVPVAQKAGVIGPIDVEPSPMRAIERAWRVAPTVCAAGSIFLIGDLLASLTKARNDADG